MLGPGRRHRLRAVHPVPPSAPARRRALAAASRCARALATAGSAVVFAGATVDHRAGRALGGQDPGADRDGTRRRGAVTVAVLDRPDPAARRSRCCSASGCGPQPHGRRRSAKRQRKPRPPKPARAGFGAFWVRTVTRLPVLTVVAVLALLGLAAVPAVEHAARAARQQHRADLVAPSARPTTRSPRRSARATTHPLSITADVITSTDPKGTVSKLADAIKAVPGVVAVTQATPNRAPTPALIQVIPSAGQTAPSTSDLVRELRARAPGLGEGVRRQPHPRHRPDGDQHRRLGPARRRAAALRAPS